MNKLRRALLAFVIAAAALVVSPVGPVQIASAMTPTSHTTCGQSGYLGRRVCFDRSAQRIYVYTSDTSTAAPSSSYPAASPGTSSGGYCSPFTSTGSEFSDVGWVYGARCYMKTGAGYYPIDLALNNGGSGGYNSIGIGGGGYSTVVGLGGYAAYEFVWTN